MGSFPRQAKCWSDIYWHGDKSIKSQRHSNCSKNLSKSINLWSFHQRSWLDRPRSLLTFLVFACNHYKSHYLNSFPVRDKHICVPNAANGSTILVWFHPPASVQKSTNASWLRPITYGGGVVCVEAESGFVFWGTTIRSLCCLQMSTAPRFQRRQKKLFKSWLRHYSRMAPNRSLLLVIISASSRAPRASVSLP